MNKERVAIVERTGRRVRCARLTVLIAGLIPAAAFAQTPLTWQQIVQKFETTNPTMKANQLNIDESRAAEITAYLRPNPDFSQSADGFQVHSNSGVYRRSAVW
jgi:cobalt-zinc-cadmium efflux system outer membrane protein